MAVVQTLRIQVILNPSVSTEDQVMNTWHIATEGATTPDTAAGDFVNTFLDSFYQSIDVQLAGELQGAVPLVRCFNLIEPKPRQPHAEMNLTALTTTSSALPREVACCLSYKAQYQSGVSPKRRRGRIYLGPLQNGAITSSTGLFASGMVSLITSAAQTLIDASQASALWKWVVYSPTTDTAGTGETGMYPVVSGWVDDNPDIQRRRNKAVGVRSTFS